MADKNKNNYLWIGIVVIAILFLVVVIFQSQNNAEKSDCRIADLEIQDKHLDYESREVPIKVKVSNFGDKSCDIHYIWSPSLWGSLPVRDDRVNAKLDLYGDTNGIVNPKSTEEYVLTGYLTDVDVGKTSGSPLRIDVYVHFNDASKDGNQISESYVIRVFK